MWPGKKVPSFPLTSCLIAQPPPALPGDEAEEQQEEEEETLVEVMVAGEGAAEHHLGLKTSRIHIVEQPAITYLI